MQRFQEEPCSETFEALYRATSPVLTSWILHLCARYGRGLDPAEVLQDTYVNIYRYARSFRPQAPAGFRGWARSIAANLVRRAARLARGPFLSGFPEGSAEPADLRSSPELVLSTGEQGSALQRGWTLLLVAYLQAYQALSTRDRKALELVEVDGLSYSEVGRLLGVGPSNTKMILFRARRRLHQRLGRAMDGERLPARRAG